MSIIIVSSSTSITEHNLSDVEDDIEIIEDKCETSKPPKLRKKSNHSNSSFQQSLVDMFSSQAKYSTGSVQDTRLTNAVAKFICKAAVALNIVETEAFQELLEEFDPRSVNLNK